ncbi:MAG: hypothetical protein ACRC92_26705 [Peptostreptococcaceae bacterium]
MKIFNFFKEPIKSEDLSRLKCGDLIIERQFCNYLTDCLGLGGNYENRLYVVVGRRPFWGYDSPVELFDIINNTYIISDEVFKDGVECTALRYCGEYKMSWNTFRKKMKEYRTWTEFTRNTIATDMRTDLFYAFNVFTNIIFHAFSDKLYRDRFMYNKSLKRYQHSVKSQISGHDDYWLDNHFVLSKNWEPWTR